MFLEKQGALVAYQGEGLRDCHPRLFGAKYLRGLDGPLGGKTRYYPKQMLSCVE